jgi:hypothetical protein
LKAAGEVTEIAGVVVGDIAGRPVAGGLGDAGGVGGGSGEGHGMALPAGAEQVVEVVFELGDAHELRPYERSGDPVAGQGVRRVLQSPVDEPQLLGVAGVGVDAEASAEQVADEGGVLGLGVLVVARGADDSGERSR